MAITSLLGNASAADLGGNAYADLEERIAELEATTVKKGNRKVSLTLSGYVSSSIMSWDDGGKRDTYIGDGGAVSSRFRFAGTAKMTPDISAGVLYEFGMQNNRLGNMNQLAGGDDLGANMEIRQSTVWIKHERLGKVQIGHGSTATDDLILIDTSNSGVIAFADPGVFNGGMFTRLSSVTVNGVAVPGASGVLVPVNWASLLNGNVSFDTARRNHVLYESPALAGFTLTAATGENNFWDVALRYAGELGGFRLAGGIGYSVDTETPTFGPIGLSASKITDTKGSASIKHMGTGIFVTAAGGLREVDWTVSGGGFSASAKDAHFWHVIAGIEQNWFGFGKTTLFGEAHNAKHMVGYSFAGPGVSASIDSTANMWGVGVIQAVDAAAMDLFLSYKRFSADATLSAPGLNAKVDVHDFSAVIAGARIQF